MAEATTQGHLNIEDIRSDLVILKNGNVTMVIETTALNFDLLSEKEQEIKIQQFGNLINSLTFPIQILIHTERTDITKYIESLQLVKNKQSSKALIKQMEIYIRFVKNLTLNHEVLDKRFFIAIPASLFAIKKSSMMGNIFGGQKQVNINVDKVIAKAQLELYPKRDHLIKQLKNIGLIAKQLNTDDLIKLYYAMYSPDKAGYNQLSLSREDFSAGMVRGN